MNMQIMRDAARKHPHLILTPYDELINASNGFEAICLFSNLLGGSTTYVPTLKTIFLGCLNESARGDFKGANYTELCRKYGLSERHIRRILKGT